MIWPVDEIGAPHYHGYLLGAGPELLDRPGVVRAFLDATARGFHAARTPRSATGC